MHETAAALSIEGLFLHADIVLKAVLLAAAIPAVVAYNKLMVDLGRFASRMQALIGRSGGLFCRT